MFPMLGESRTRGHSLRIRSKPFRTETRKHFFSQRVVSLWNSLPQRAVEAGSLDAFKRELDRALKDIRLTPVRRVEVTNLADEDNRRLI